MKTQVENEKLRKEKNQIGEELNSLKKLFESEKKQLTELKEKSLENNAENEIMKSKIENLCNEKSNRQPPFFLFLHQPNPN